MYVHMACQNNYYDLPQLQVMYQFRRITSFRSSCSENRFELYSQLVYCRCKTEACAAYHETRNVKKLAKDPCCPYEIELIDFMLYQGATLNVTTRHLFVA